MARTRPAGQILMLLADSTRQQYICRACRAQRIRQLHTSPRACADDKRPYFQRLKDTLFGNKKDAAEQKWEEEAAERRKEMARQYNDRNPMEQRSSRDNTQLYNIAPVVDPTINREYIPAPTWDGLERMGGKNWAKAQHDGGEAYEGYAPAKLRRLSDSQWQELFLSVIGDLQDEGALAKFSRDPSLERADSSWMSVALPDANAGLLVAKRITQLTGCRIPDPVISSASTVANLYDAVKAKEKPQKLAEMPEVQQLNSELPNVQIHRRKRSMITKEKEVGRWKLIEAELNARDLPVTGTRHPQGKAVIEPQKSRMDRKLKMRGRKETL